MVVASRDAQQYRMVLLIPVPESVGGRVCECGVCGMAIKLSLIVWGCVGSGHVGGPPLLVGARSCGCVNN